MSDFWDIEAIRKYHEDIVAQRAENRELAIIDMIDNPSRYPMVVNVVDKIKRDGYADCDDDMLRDVFSRKGFSVLPAQVEEGWGWIVTLPIIELPLSVPVLD